MTLRPLLLSLAVMAVAFAGCVSSDPPPSDGSGEAARAPTTQVRALAHVNTSLPTPEFLCHVVDGESVCNFNMTPDPARQGNEVTIAVNPKDPRNIVGGAKDYYPPDAGECVWDGVYVTKDGGASYADRSFDGSPWRQLTDPDPSKVNYATQFWCTTDPVAYFNAKGDLYYLLMAYQADRVTGSKACEHECPEGAFNDWAFNRAVQIVAISSDGGDSFHTFTPVLEGSYPVAFHDKGWVAASNDGTVHVGWLSFVLGNLYFRSVDGGKTYSDPVVMAPFLAGAGQGTFVDVGAGKEVYYSWAARDCVMLARSVDTGASWDDARCVIPITDPKPPKGLSSRDRRDGTPALATDRSMDSPFAGAVYFAWQGGEEDGNDIYFAASFDGGETYTEQIRLNDDDSSVPQIFPAISVSPGGVIDVSWMDSRLDAANDGYLIDQYYTYSLDGGKTWAPNFRVRDADDNGWDPALSHHQNGKIFIGDYNDIDSSWEAAHPVWPDTRDGATVNVYTATLKRPIFADGFPEGKKGEVLAWIADHPLA